MFRVTERNDNSLKLVDAHNKERVANIRDLILLSRKERDRSNVQALLYENNQRPETASTEMESETLLAPKLLRAAPWCTTCGKKDRLRWTTKSCPLWRKLKPREVA